MATMKPSESGWLFAKRVFIGDENEKDYPVIFRHTKGEPMKYGKDAARVIDFPGEYDLEGMAITCKDSWGQLHYVVRYEGNNYAMIFNKAILDSDSLDEIDVWWVGSEEIRDSIEKMELDGEVHVFGEEKKKEETEV